MDKPKNKQELKTRKQKFYDNLIEDTKLNIFVDRISKTSADDPNFPKLWEEMYEYMDKEFQKYVGLTRKEAQDD